ncbi:hypothetical protein BDZ97DRAFT_1920386 [Flammula alnicola]|nr:hypothetical protein BDZ97DRAFT_1920386 [Flammula alnicola]
MALQTETHTSTDSAPANTAPPPPNDVQHTAFSPAGSPPLILAFLAIGLFSAAMIIVFGWRRIQLGRAFTVGGIPINHAASTNRTNILPNKPKLWEPWYADEVTWSQVSGNTEKGAGYYDGEWANMLPLAAKAVSTDIGVVPEDSKPSNTPSTSLHRNLLDPQRQILRSLWPRSWRHHPSKPHEAHELQSTDKSPPTSKTLQVGVAIIMPSPHFPIYVKERTDTNTEYHEEEKSRKRKEITEFSIGLYDCTWE